MIHDALLRSEYSRAVLKRFLLIFLPLAVLLGAIGVAHYYTDRKLAQVKREAADTLNVDLVREVVAGELRTVVSDLMFLAQLNELRAMLDKPDRRQLAMLAREFLAFSQKKGIYDQMRYLDAAGTEVIRVNYNNGSPHVVARNKLQNKAGRYYFRDTLTLGRGEVYISPFDLNVEQGRIEQPRKPVVRFATPLFDSRGRKKGILVLNFLGGKLIQSFKQAAANIADHVNLVNAEGYWLSSPRPEDEWGFMLDHGRSFAQTHPAAWKHILARDGGRFYGADGLFTFTTVYPAASIKQQRSGRGPGDRARLWKIISHVPPGMLAPVPQGFFSRHLLVYGSMGLLLILGALVVAQTGVKHRLAKARSEYERHFRATLETIQLAAITLDPAGRITFCNDFLLERTGWSRDEVIGRDCFETFVSSEDRPKTQAMLFQATDLNTFPSTFENRILTRQGEPRLFSWNGTLSRGSDGKVTAVTCIGKDITEQRRTEEQLRKLSRAVEQSPSPVIITNTGGVIEYVNPKFTQLTGYTAEEVVGKTPGILKSGETSSQEYEKLWETIKTGGEWRGLFHNRKKNGELYWEYTAISPIRNAEGKITHFLAVKEDVTERKRLEQEVEARNRELARTQALAVVGRMSSMIAHDLRNPLSSIKMGLQILGKRAVEKEDDETHGAEANELKQIALEQVRYMEDILADLLRFSRPDALKPEWLSVNKVLDMTISSTERAIKEHGARVITEYQPQLPTAHGDPTKLRQVFSNLILNALQATENTDRKPELRIRTRLELGEHAPRIRVELSDNGLGIDMSQTNKLFEPFYTTRAKGTGLGLAIVKRILDQHHGSITLARAENGGTCATVILPTRPVEH